jgi:hypothetical protein
MSENLPGSTGDNETWFTVVGEDADFVTIRPDGSDSDVNVPKRTGFDSIDNPSEDGGVQ